MEMLFAPIDASWPEASWTTPLPASALATAPATVHDRTTLRRRRTLLSVLLEASSPATTGGRAALRAIWADEAMHRANSLLTLVQRLEQTAWTSDQAEFDIDLEYAIACRLADSFRSLDMTSEMALRSCEDVLRAVTSRMMALFAPSVGGISLRLNLARLTLPAYRMRALVLLGNELVSNALLHAFDGSSDGTIAVSLTSGAWGQMSLVVEDDGFGPQPDCQGPGCSIVAGLAGVLGGQVETRRSQLGGTEVECRFSV